MFLKFIDPGSCTIGLSLLCSKICLYGFLTFPQFSAYYACFYAFQNCIMLLFCVCTEKFFISYSVNGEDHFDLQHTNNTILKRGCAP